MVAFPLCQVLSLECHSCPRQLQNWLGSELKLQPLLYPQILPWFSQVTSPCNTHVTLGMSLCGVFTATGPYKPLAQCSRVSHDLLNSTHWVLLPPLCRRDVKWPPQGHRASKWLNLDWISDLCDLKVLPWDEGPILPRIGMEVLRAPEANRRQLLCPHMSGTFLWREKLSAPIATTWGFQLLTLSSRTIAVWARQARVTTLHSNLFVLISPGSHFFLPSFSFTFPKSTISTIDFKIKTSGLCTEAFFRKVKNDEEALFATIRTL